MQKITWTLPALDDIAALRAYISFDNPRAAQQQVERILKAAQVLLRFPGSGRPGRCHGTREFVVSKTPYILAYQKHGPEIEILRVFHSHQKWPEGF